MSDKYKEYNQDAYRTSGPPRSYPPNYQESVDSYQGGYASSGDSLASSRRADYSQQGATPAKTRVSRFDYSYKKDEKPTENFYDESSAASHHRQNQPPYASAYKSESEFRPRERGHFSYAGGRDVEDGRNDQFHSPRHDEPPRSHRYNRDDRTYSSTSSYSSDYGRGDHANSGDQIVMDDTIFVSNLPKDVTEEELGEFFGVIGVIKIDKKTRKHKIYIYRDGEGVCKGEATITYDDSQTVSAAINWLNGKEMRGCILNIEVAKRKAPINSFRRGGRGGRGRGGFDRNFGGSVSADEPASFGTGDNRRGRGGGFVRGGGDWTCTQCGNVNFARRTQCNRCQNMKPEDGAGDDDIRADSYGSGGSSYGRAAPYETASSGGFRSGGGSYDRGGRGGSYRGGFSRGRGREGDRSFGQDGGSYQPYQ